MKKSLLAQATALLISVAAPALADAPTIDNVTADNRGGAWTFSVTISHPETGWDHYADGWEVLAADGTSLGIRVLVHPHVDEQPFTRSLGSVEIPVQTSEVFIRARDNVDGWADARYRVDLTQ